MRFAIKRDIPEEKQREFLAAMRESVQYAMTYSRGADKELVKKFTLMYVNK